LSPRWPKDVALLHDLRGRLDVGLHLDWTSEFAVASGHGLSLGQAMLKAAFGGFDPVTARAVIERQLDAFEAHWQAPPDYVDGHQHVQQFAGIREALAQALAQRYGRQSVKPYLRISRAPSGTADLKARVIAAMGASSLEKLAAREGLTGAKALSGIYDFSGNAERYAGLMAGWLNEAPAGGIIMCHPAIHAEPGDIIGSARAQEFGYLNSDDFPLALATAGVVLSRYPAPSAH
jgi:predicted glycoside hydrolase/deacetylase ChbG (UPF0249 family)